MDYDAVERDLKVKQMQADIQNENADTVYKQGLLKYEPWKVMATVVTATAAVVGVVSGALGFLLGRLH